MPAIWGKFSFSHIFPARLRLPNELCVGKSGQINIFQAQLVKKINSELLLPWGVALRNIINNNLCLASGACECGEIINQLMMNITYTNLDITGWRRTFLLIKFTAARLDEKNARKFIFIFARKFPRRASNARDSIWPRQRQRDTAAAKVSRLEIKFQFQNILERVF